MSDDRTAEFLSLARSLPQNQLPQPATSLPQGGATTAPNATGRYGPTLQRAASGPAYDDLRTFHKTAADISKDIAATSAMLSELTQLVRQKSLFEEDSSRVNELVLRIKGNIENLNSRLDQAGIVLKQQKRRINTQAGQEATNLVGQLKEEFVQATAGFKKVLQQRTDTLKETSDRKKQVYGTSSGSMEYVSLDSKPLVYDTPSSAQFPTLDLTSGMSAGESTSSTPQLPRPRTYILIGLSNESALLLCTQPYLTSFLCFYPFLDGVAGHGGGSYTTPGLRMRHGSDMPSFSGSTSSFDMGSAPLTPLDIQRMEQDNEQMMQLIPDQTYLRERADAMSTVESNIVELGTIFNKLAVMVSEHREMVQRVEDNVDDVENNVNLSMSVLTDTLTNLRTNRALVAKVFSIFVLFIIFFIIFVA